jgi:uncharacterized protein
LFAGSYGESLRGPGPVSSISSRFASAARRNWEASNKNMRTVTLEEHFVTPSFLKATAAFVPDHPYLREMRAKLADLGEGRLAAMDQAGIDMQVLSLASMGLDDLDAATATALTRDVNDELASVIRARPDRFAGFAALALRDPENAARELERAVKTLHLKGVMVNGTTGGAFLDDSRFTPVLEAAQHLDVPIYLHPAPPPKTVESAYFADLPGMCGDLLSRAGWGWHVETGLHCLRMIVSGIFDRFPRLRLVIGHMGEDLPYSLARAEAVLAPGTKHLQRSVSEYFHHHFHVTTSGYFTIPPFLCALEVVGADRLLFSVDYPFSTTMQGRQFLDTLPLNPTDREKIAYQNADRLLGIPAASQGLDGRRKI